MTDITWPKPFKQLAPAIVACAYPMVRSMTVREAADSMAASYQSWHSYFPKKSSVKSAIELGEAFFRAVQAGKNRLDLMSFCDDESDVRHVTNWSKLMSLQVLTTTGWWSIGEILGDMNKIGLNTLGSINNPTPTPTPTDSAPATPTPTPATQETNDMSFASLNTPTSTQAPAPAADAAAAGSMPDLNNIMGVIAQAQGQIAAVTAERDVLKEKADKFDELVNEATEYRRRAEAADEELTQLKAQDQSGEIQRLQDQIAAIQASAPTAAVGVDTSSALTKAQVIEELSADDKLLAIENKLQGTDDLDLATCVAETRGAMMHTELPDVEWPHWCKPENPLSKLPFAVSQRLATCLTGPSGTGKTFIAEAYLIKMFGAVCTVPCHEDMSWQELFLRTRVKDGKTYYVLGIIPMAMLANVPVIIDEGGHLRSSIISQLHETVDKFRCHIPELGITVDADPSWRLLMTDNGLGDDSGDYDAYIPPAMVTRLHAIKVQYPSKKEEKAIVKAQSKISSDHAKKVADLFASLRKIQANPQADVQLEGAISTREACNFGHIIRDALALGSTIESAARMASGLVLEDKRTLEAAAVIEDECSKIFGKVQDAQEAIDNSGFLQNLANGSTEEVEAEVPTL